jgi:hypothetical protein
VKVVDAKRNANIYGSAFYYAVNQLERMRHITNGARKRDCRSIVNVYAIANAVDAAISHSGKRR